jgi:hypothetical protein
MLHATPPGNAAGASAEVFGLLAICMVWSPRNELNCLVILIVFVRWWVFNWELRYTTVALIYVGEQIWGLFMGGLTGRAVVSELGHLSGAFWGTVVAVIMVKAGWVDCEGWDLFSLATKNRQLARDWKRREAMLDSINRPTKKRRSKQSATVAEEGPDAAAQAASALRKVRKLIDMGDFAGAVAAYDRSARVLPSWPDQTQLYELIKELHGKGAESESVPLLRDYCRCYPEGSAKVRLKLAQILVRDRQKPTAALRVLAEIARGSLPPELDAARDKLVRKATRMQEEGILEVEGDD